MILELLEYLTTDCPADVRRLGYLKEAIAIKARYRRQCEAWGPHLARSRALVGDAAEHLARRRTALVLGSGLLLDIPLGALSASFDRVLLADLVHLRRARRIAARYPNVALVTADVTGLSAGFRDRVRSGWRGTPVPQPCLFHDDETIDLVVSANLMAQLPVMPAAALRRAGRDDQTVQAFCRAVVEAHLAYLAGFRRGSASSPRSCARGLVAMAEFSGSTRPCSASACPPKMRPGAGIWRPRVRQAPTTGSATGWWGLRIYTGPKCRFDLLLSSAYVSPASEVGARGVLLDKA